MGKRRKDGDERKPVNTKPKGKMRVDADLRSSLLDPSAKNFIYDEIDEFEENRDRVSLQTAKKLMERKPIPREQVLAIDGSSSEDDEDDVDDEEEEEDDDDDDASKDSDEDKLYMEDDIVDEPEFQMADERGWGSNKRWRFGTDITEKQIKYNMYNQDEEMAQVEEETARKLQERMAAELKDLVSDDLILQVDEEEAKEAVTEDLVETDVSSLSRSRKLQLLKRESPEFLPIIEDLKSKCEELKCILNPLMRKVKSGKVPEGPIRQYITTKYRLVLNYVSTISMYMLVKCSCKSVRNHPVVGRLAQYRQLLQELDACDNKLASHLGRLLADDTEEKESPIETLTRNEEERPRKRKKELQVLKKSKSAKLEEKKRLMSLLKEPIVPKDKSSKGYDKKNADVMEDSSDEEQETQEVAGNEKREMDPDEKRALGYKITKNKGLMPYRNKDQRNPRVRYRNKYTKKLKRRKGQFKGVRKELERYGGEMTGIKSHTIKSVQIKS